MTTAEIIGTVLTSLILPILWWMAMKLIKLGECGAARNVQLQGITQELKEVKDLAMSCGASHCPLKQTFHERKKEVGVR